MNNSIKSQIENLPTATGIYKFLDNTNKILYIGKALNLKSRVSSYFRDSHFDRPHIIKMIPQINKIETIATENEVESLILESALIKKYRPKFNVELKDDKSFSWIYISTKDKFPTVKIVRSIKKEDYKKGKLFGPYPKGKPIKRIFDYIRKLYPFCTCKNPKDLCLYYHLDLCPGPYHGKISQKDYKANIDNIIKFLNGKSKNLITDLKREMVLYANRKDFEKAAKLRDKIDDLQYLSQKISISPFESDEDYLNSRYQKIRNSLISLSKKLNLESLNRIECFDVSNIQGKFAYGAMSVAVNGKLIPEEYRIFKIRGFKDSNDPGMIEEIVSRRLKHQKKVDLILIDGGVSQLSLLKKNIPQNIKIIGISKGKRLKNAGKKQKDEFWLIENDTIKRIKIPFPYLLIELRDEAHRFGIKYHRRSMSKYLKTSILDDIEGIGTKRRKNLFKTFKDISGIKKASFEELNKVVKNKKVVKRIKAHVY